MKLFRLLCLAAVCGVLFTGCRKDPFAQTDEGSGTLSCKINGEPCISVNRFSNFWRVLSVDYSGIPGQNYELYLTARCFHVDDSKEEVGYSLEIALSDTEPFVVGRKYYLSRDEDGGYASWRGAQAYSGCVQLRKLERVYYDKGSHVVVSGNFEFEALSEPEKEGEPFVKYVCNEGTFDARCETDVL